MLAAAALLLVWHLYKRSITGALFAAGTIALCVICVWFETRGIAMAVWSGVGLAGSVASFMALRQHGVHWGLLPGGILGLPLIGTLGLSLIAHHGFSVTQVSNTTPLLGEKVSLTITGIFDVPAGDTAVYLFPAQEGPVRGRTEPLYYLAERDHRYTAAVHHTAFPRPRDTPAFVAGETKEECQGGDICRKPDIAIPGIYQIGVAIPHPFLSWNTLLIPGPVIDITVSDAQRESVHLQDEAAFLHDALCDAVQARQTRIWAFMREHHPCGGFFGARAATDPDVPVWDEYREKSDTRPPMSIKDGMLCLNDTAQAPYTGEAKVCMPYAGEPKAPLPEPDMIVLSFHWGGSEHWIFEDEAIGTFEDIARDEGKKRFRAFDMPNYSGNLVLEDQGDGHHTYRFKRLDSYAQHKYGGQPSTGKWVSSVLATLGPDHRLCLFYELVGQTSLPDDHFTDPTHWAGCTVIVDPPQGGAALK